MALTNMMQKVYCRRALAPACDPTVETAATANPPSIDGDIIYVRQGDIIDVGIDWTHWLDANDARLKSSSWAGHASSPNAPTITDDGFDLDKGHTVAIIDTSASTVGDVYWMNNTVVVEDPSSTSNGYSIPDRTFTRLIHVKVSL